AGPVQLREQLHPRHVPAGKLTVAVTHVRVLRQRGAEEVLEIAGEMQRQRAAGVGDARDGTPYAGVIRILLDLATDCAQLAQEHGAKRVTYGERAHGCK